MDPFVDVFDQREGARLARDFLRERVASPIPKITAKNSGSAFVPFVS
jgi:hypothetical protein